MTQDDDEFTRHVAAEVAECREALDAVIRILAGRFGPDVDNALAGARAQLGSLTALLMTRAGPVVQERDAEVRQLRPRKKGAHRA
jgi:hypothetical protein